MHAETMTHYSSPYQLLPRLKENRGCLVGRFLQMTPRHRAGVRLQHNDP